MHIFVFDAVLEIFDRQSVFFLSNHLFGVQYFEDTFGRGHTFLYIVIALRERLGRGDNL